MDFESKFDARLSTQIALSAEALTAISNQLEFGEATSAKKLGGGFSNSNYLIEFDTGKCCVARLSLDVTRLLMEADLICHIANSAPAVPLPLVLYSSSEPLIDDLGCVLMSYVEGETIANIEDSISASNCRDICEQVARYAAMIHKIEFEANGLIEPGASLSQVFPSYLEGTVGYLEFCLDDKNLKSRLGSKRVAILQSYLHRAELHLPPETQRLCHGDFNQKNILVRKNSHGGWQVSAILDWEFALSASGIMDVGNLLRFEDESPCVNSAWFSSAYLAAGGSLAENWRSQAMFADLMAQCTFLLSDQERPKTMSTVIGVIDLYISALGG